MLKYRDIERVGHPENETMLANNTDVIVVEEKVDGGNGSIWIEGGNLHTGSRNRDLTSDGDEKTFTAMRKWALEQIKEPLDSNLVYYVEWMQKHSVNYGKGIPLAIGLDILPKTGAFGKTPQFFGRHAKEVEFARIGLPCIALVGIFTAKELTEEKLTELLNIKSAYYDGKPEGIVLKNYSRQNIYGKQMFGKLVREDFKELNRAVFGGNKQDTTETVKIAQACATPARINKKIDELLIQGGQTLSRGLMKFLVIAVMRDIFKEEPDLLLGQKVMYVGTFKAIVAKECLNILDKRISEVAINGAN